MGFRLPAMNSTRWNSQFLMLSKFLEALDIDPHLMTKLNACKKYGKLNALDLKILKEIVTVLEPFKISTDAFQKDLESLGFVIPAYLDMLNKCSLDLKVNPDADKLLHCRGLVSVFKSSLESRLSYVMSDVYYLLGKKILNCTLIYYHLIK